MYPILPVHQSISPLHSSVVPHTVLMLVPLTRVACLVSSCPLFTASPALVPLARFVIFLLLALASQDSFKLAKVFVPEMVCVPVSVTYPFRSADCNAVSALAKDAIVVESKEIVPLDVIGHPVSPVPVAILVTVPPPPVGNNS